MIQRDLPSKAYQTEPSVTRVGLESSEFGILAVP